MFSERNTRLIAFITLILALSCKSQNYNSSHSNAVNRANSICPEGGNCSFNLSPNTAVFFEKDEFGFGYVTYLEKETTLLKFEYKRDDIPNAVDGQYIERIYLELPNIPKTLLLQDQELQQVNLLFERVCYCKGETGFYQINRGTLSLKPLGDDRFHLQLSFKASEVPQIITTIDETFSLK